ncbi:8-oxoguanine deaminase [Paenibacillus sp. CGMCC 1.16610]|uniref:8-oxoguanine deaminase n=1 Tax=Paenibacillus anseongense TaxID=2682845 RepID=A0ABW9UII2_9BACL|nr:MULTISPECIES: 8-oxoguanine deaminase [Paenibacillus]MBA2942775.1 8-oxoguanine deaminase [Paenibacillus sp. CGMCC 1.16610]MVQ38260.1 8-oxoguanine deaminase [Paenibacillus anseongense]
MSSLLIRNAKAIVTVDAGDRVLEGANILIEGNRITKMGKDMYEADRVVDASQMFVYPGLVNVHHHLYQTFTRNLPQVQKLELFDWLRYLYEIWKGITPDTVYHSSLTGIADLMKNGCTTVFDHHYVFPQQNSAHFIDKQFEVAERLGIRFVASRGSMTLGKDQGGLPPMSVVQDLDTILADSERLIDRYHDASAGSMRQVVLAPCSPFSVSADLMRESAKLARAKGVRLHTHLAETKNEEAYTLERFGMRPLAYMESLDWLGADVWYAHGIHFNDEEMRLLALTKTGVAHCPISNMKLSSGIARVPEMLSMGIPVGLAVDGSASNDGSNLLEELRVAYLLHRLQSSAQAPSGYDLLKIATRGGAEILGRSDIGSLEVGKAADLFMVRVDHIDAVGTQTDPKSWLATVGLKRPVDYTIVDGKVVVENGRLVGEDEDRLAMDCQASFERFMQQ